MKIDAFDFVFVMLVKQFFFLILFQVGHRVHTHYTHTDRHVKLEITQK